MLVKLNLLKCTCYQLFSLTLHQRLELNSEDNWCELQGFYEALNRDKMQNREGDLQFCEHENFLLVIISVQRPLIMYYSLVNQLQITSHSVIRRVTYTENSDSIRHKMDHGKSKKKPNGKCFSELLACSRLVIFLSVVLAATCAALVILNLWMVRRISALEELRREGKQVCSIVLRCLLD